MRAPGKIGAFLAALALCLWLPLSAAPAGQNAGATVERLNAALIGVMQQAETLGYQGRYDRLAPDLEAVFDFPAMARAALGRHWRAASAEEKTAFTEAFTAFSIAVFADRFDGYSGERFEVTGEQPARRGTVLVRNQLVKTDGEIIAIDYLARPDQADGGWRLIDTFLEAKYSEIAARRSEYSSIVQNQGLEALIAALKDKTAGYAAP